MGLTYGEAKSLGLEKLHPAATRGRSAERELLDRLDAAGKPASKAPDHGMNKTEWSFWNDVLCAAWARSAIERPFREPVKFRLAGRTWYTPDFMVESVGTRLLTFIEIKGFMRDDAAVKLKVAASTYPSFRWLLVVRDGRHGWSVREVGRNGIGREPITVPWINGGVV